MTNNNSTVLFNHNCIWQIRRQFGVYFCDMLMIKYTSEIIDKTRNYKQKISEDIFFETDTLTFIYENFDIKILSFEEYRIKFFPNFTPN